MHSEYVRELARGLVFDATLAQDVEQDVWLAALAAAPRDPGVQRGWLAGVVRKVAQKAWRTRLRRRDWERAAAGERSVPSPSEVMEREELRRGLVEVVNGLEEPYRGALVLRYLEGCEVAEVARRLGVPLETARTRLRRGLELVRARMDRERGGRERWCVGFVSAFGLGPPSWVKLGGLVVSSSVGGSGVLAMGGFKHVALVGLVVLSGCAVWFATRNGESKPVGQARSGAGLEAPVGGGEAEPAERASEAGEGERVAAAPTSEVPAVVPQAQVVDVVAVDGRVVDPEGKPAEGVEVFLTRMMWDARRRVEPFASGRSDARGEFRFEYRKSDERFGVDVERPEMWKYVTVWARAKGLGTAWLELHDWKPGEWIELRLVPETALTGRILDVEGRPVAGVRARVISVFAFEPERLDVLLAKPSARAQLPGRYLRPAPEHGLWAETGPDGRFSIAGLGPERLVSLDLRGEDVVQQHVDVVTRDMPRLEYEDFALEPMPGASNKQILLGNGFEWTMQPARAITGVVRDARDGRALAGVTVMSQIMAGRNFMTHALDTQSDAEGRFRLTGMPKGEGNQLLMLPNDEQPYFMAEVDVPDPAGVEPVEIEVLLERGVWIRGRVTEKHSGQPGYGSLFYLPFLDNPYAKEVFGDGTDGLPNMPGAMFQRRYRTDARGNFRLVGLPGRAIVGVQSVQRFRQGSGAENIPGLDEEGRFATYSNPLQAGAKWPTAMRLVEIGPLAQETECNLELDKGGAQKLLLIDPRGDPVTGCKVVGRAGYWERELFGPEVTIELLGPGEERLLRIHQAERCLSLATAVSLQDGTGAQQPRRVVLAPCMTLTGRVRSEAGEPLSNVQVETFTDIDFDSPPQTVTDDDGYYRFEHIPAGLPFAIWARSDQIEDGHHTIEREFLPPPNGGTVDLGDARVKLAK